MTHFGTLVLIDAEVATREAAEKQVARLLAPYDENGEWFRDGARWDWWIIGGRWTGTLDGYDPYTDSRNMETCSLCGGTGERPGGRQEFGEAWYEGCNGCNGCSGKGTRVSYRLKDHAGDVMPVAGITREDIAEHIAAIVTPDGKWHEASRAHWFGATFTENENGEPPKSNDVWRHEVVQLLLQHREATAVMVDCHV